MNVRFEVSVNGQRLCVAGLPSFGVLGINITSMERNPEQAAKIRGRGSLEELLAPECKVMVTGLDNSDIPRKSMVRWVEEDGVDLNPGDEIMIRVLSAGESDPPVRISVGEGPPLPLSKWVPPQSEPN